MKKTLLTTGFVLTILLTKGQIKVYTGGNVAIGSTSTTPQKPLDVIGSGGIRISQSSDSSSNNEIYFLDNGQIRSADDNHRIIFDRSNNILELREYGKIVFSPGSGGVRTQKVTFTQAGDINLNGSSNSYQINANKVLWNNGHVENIFVGVGAGVSTTGLYNSAFGYHALYTNTTGIYNAAIGYNALQSSTATANTAVGYNSLGNTTSGAANTAIGEATGSSNSTGSYNTFIGYIADANANNYTNATSLGNSTLVTASNRVVIGNNSVTSIGGPVGWTNFSDGRFKTNVQENVKGLAFIKKLRPVTYNMNLRGLDDFITQNMNDSIKMMRKAGMDFTASTAIVHSGFIAQEVEQAAKAVGYNNTIVHAPENSNDLYALSYAEFVVPLVKAVQELSKTTDSLTTIVHKQDSLNKELKKQIANCCTANGTALGTSNSNVQSAGSNGQLSAVLYQNIPNPFNQTTNIKCFIPDGSKNASLLIFDMNGTLKRSVAINQRAEANITINAKELIAGMYYYSLIIDGNEIDTKKMILTEQ
ncbi:MAG TPA: tail fiber domain-containing protein [Bacteroidia bacterium]|nr:tail fiber domain-containing protein [Bacteroidia bacterium]